MPCVLQLLKLLISIWTPEGNDHEPGKQRYRKRERPNKIHDYSSSQPKVINPYLYN